MKRGRRQPRKKKLKPHETMDGMKAIVMDGQAKLWGHKVEWRQERTYESIGVCARCNAVAVIVLRPLGVENIITGDVVHKECPDRNKETKDE